MSELYQLLQNVPPSAGAVPVVAHYHLYKALREEEQIALRALVRVFSMHSSTDGSQQRLQQRMLEDLCDAFCISPSVLESERAHAAVDPVVQAIRQLGDIKQLRDSHHDAFNDMNADAWAQAATQAAAEDDGATVLASTSRKPSHQQHQGAKGGGGIAKTAATNKGRQHEIKHATAMFTDAQDAAKNFVQIPEGNERDAAHQRLRELRLRVHEQIAILEAEQ
jgi:hypothetical protein